MNLRRLRPMRDAACGLTLPRTNALALLCAGNDADHGEVQGAGDLLLNPRRVLVDIKGMLRPVVKARHVALTEILRCCSNKGEGVVAWFREKTVIEIEF